VPFHTAASQEVGLRLGGKGRCGQQCCRGFIIEGTIHRYLSNGCALSTYYLCRQGCSHGFDYFDGTSDAVSNRSNLHPEACLYSASTLPAPHALVSRSLVEPGGSANMPSSHRRQRVEPCSFPPVDSTPTRRAPPAHHLHAICFESSATKDRFESAELSPCQHSGAGRMMPSLVPQRDRSARMGGCGKN
jgi:hypothetical protein